MHRFVNRLTPLLAAAWVCHPVWADPMRPLAAPGKAMAAASSPVAPPARIQNTPRPPARLFGIRQDSQGRMQALLGDRWVSAGDTVANATVIAISANQVDLKVGKAMSTVHLLPPLQASAEPATLPSGERPVLAATEPSRVVRQPGISQR